MEWYMQPCALGEGMGDGETQERLTASACVGLGAELRGSLPAGPLEPPGHRGRVCRGH